MLFNKPLLCYLKTLKILIYELNICTVLFYCNILLKLYLLDLIIIFLFLYGY